MFRVSQNLYILFSWLLIYNIMQTYVATVHICMYVQKVMHTERRRQDNETSLDGTLTNPVSTLLLNQLSH